MFKLLHRIRTRLNNTSFLISLFLWGSTTERTLSTEKLDLLYKTVVKSSYLTFFIFTQAQKPAPSGGTQQAMWLGQWCRGCQSLRMFWTVWSLIPLTLHLIIPPPLRASGTLLKVLAMCHGSESKQRSWFNILPSIKRIGLPLDYKAVGVL